MWYSWHITTHTAPVAILYLQADTLYTFVDDMKFDKKDVYICISIRYAYIEKRRGGECNDLLFQMHLIHI